MTCATRRVIFCMFLLSQKISISVTITPVNVFIVDWSHYSWARYNNHVRVEVRATIFAKSKGAVGRYRAEFLEVFPFFFTLTRLLIISNAKLFDILVCCSVYRHIYFCFALKRFNFFYDSLDHFDILLWSTIFLFRGWKFCVLLY
jgi:hypothetical protein